MNFRIQPRSIAFRLIAAVLAVELLSSLLVAVLSFGYERHIHFRAFDVTLHGHADSVLGAIQDADDADDNVILDQADLHVPFDDVYEVWDAAGHLLGRSPNWQGAGSGVPTRRWGDFSQLRIDGHDYRVLRIQGSRIVDPGEHGGKLRVVTIVYGSRTSRVWHAVQAAVEFYAAGSVLLLLVTGPLIAWLLHRGLLPLRQLAALATQVSAEAWQFEPPASAYNTPELAPLTQALESVLQRLERSFLQQKAFVSDAAHELKTAVAVVKSSLQVLSMKPRSAQEYQAGLERCLTDSLRLESLVADMLALARAESTAPAQSPEPASDLADCMQQAVVQLETIAAFRKVKVILVVDQPAQEIADQEKPAPKVTVGLAPEDATRLVRNLLLNALQHSPPATVVEIRLSSDTCRDTGNAVLVIRDCGDGIAPEVLPHVFDRFYRGDPSRTRNTGGTGLGLAIARALVQRAGGTIGIESQPDPADPGHGTTVTVRLPIAAQS